jgi:hypothetical protein
MTRTTVFQIMCCAAFVLSPRGVVSQEHAHHVLDTTSQRFALQPLLARARAATDIYVDRKVAIADGYRRVGRDFPSMGEHWLSTKLVVEGVFDVSRPQMLTYVKINGRPTLTGVVYIVPLQQGESPPDAFGPEALWHEHNGTIDEEGLLPEHHSTPTAVTRTRVAFLHVWIRIPNANGIFAAENWAIPFLRLELPVPQTFPNGAARALSLLSGGNDFFDELMGADASPRTGELFASCSAVAAEIAAKAKLEKRGLTVVEIQRLDDEWQKLVRAVAARSNLETAKRINGGVAPEL